MENTYSENTSSQFYLSKFKSDNVKNTLIQIFLKQDEDILLPIIKNANMISLILNFLNARNEMTSLDEKCELINFLTTNVRNLPQNADILLRSYIMVDLEVGPQQNQLIKFNLFFILIELFLLSEKDEKNDFFYIDFLKELISNVDLNKEVFEFIYQKLSKNFKLKSENKLISKNLLNKFLRLIGLLYGENANSNMPSNYFYFSGQGGLKIKEKVLSSSKMKLTSGCLFSTWFKKNNILNGLYTSSTSELFNFKLNKNQNLILLLKQNSLQIQLGTSSSENYVIDNEWTHLSLIIKPKTYRKPTELILIINEESKIIPFPNLNCDCELEEASFFNNFCGQATSILFCNKSIPEEYVKILKDFPLGIYKEKELTKLMRKGNIKYLENSSENYKPIFGLSEGCSLILENLKFLLTPFRISSNIYDRIVYDICGKFHAYLFLDSNNGVNRFRKLQNNIFYLGGINTLLPVIELMHTHSEKLLDLSTFTNFLEIIYSILNYRKKNMNDAVNRNFFQMLSLFIERMPGKVFTSEVLSIFLKIGRCLFSFADECELTSIYMEYVLLNEKIFSKFEINLQIEMWNSIYQFYVSDDSHIKTFMKISKICFLLKFYDLEKNYRYCCQEHYESFVIESGGNAGTESLVMTPNMKSKCQDLISLTRLIIEKSFEFEDCLILLKFLSLDLSPCLQTMLIEIFLSHYSNEYKIEEKKKVLAKLLSNNLLEIFFHVYHTALIDVRCYLIKLFAVFFTKDYKDIFKQSEDKLIQQLKENLFPTNLEVFRNRTPNEPSGQSKRERGLCLYSNKDAVKRNNTVKEPKLENLIIDVENQSKEPLSSNKKNSMTTKNSNRRSFKFKSIEEQVETEKDPEIENYLGEDSEILINQTEEFSPSKEETQIETEIKPNDDKNIFRIAKIKNSQPSIKSDENENEREVKNSNEKFQIVEDLFDPPTLNPFKKEDELTKIKKINPSQDLGDLDKDALNKNKPENSQSNFKKGMKKPQPLNLQIIDSQENSYINNSNPETQSLKKDQNLTPNTDFLPQMSSLSEEVKTVPILDLETNKSKSSPMGIKNFGNASNKILKRTFTGKSKIFETIKLDIEGINKNYKYGGGEKVQHIEEEESKSLESKIRSLAKHCVDFMNGKVDSHECNKFNTFSVAYKYTNTLGDNEDEDNSIGTVNPLPQPKSVRGITKINYNKFSLLNAEIIEEQPEDFLTLPSPFRKSGSKTKKVEFADSNDKIENETGKQRTSIKLKLEFDNINIDDKTKIHHDIEETSNNPKTKIEIVDDYIPNSSDPGLKKNLNNKADQVTTKESLEQHLNKEIYSKILNSLYNLLFQWLLDKNEKSPKMYKSQNLNLARTNSSILSLLSNNDFYLDDTDTIKTPSVISLIIKFALNSDVNGVQKLMQDFHLLLINNRDNCLHLIKSSQFYSWLIETSFKHFQLGGCYKKSEESKDKSANSKNNSSTSSTYTHDHLASISIYELGMKIHTELLLNLVKEDRVTVEPMQKIHFLLSWGIHLKTQFEYSRKIISEVNHFIKNLLREILVRLAEKVYNSSANISFALWENFVSFTILCYEFMTFFNLEKNMKNDSICLAELSYDTIIVPRSIISGLNYKDPGQDEVYLGENFNYDYFCPKDNNSQINKNILSKKSGATHTNSLSMYNDNLNFANNYNSENVLSSSSKPRHQKTNSFSNLSKNLPVTPKRENLTSLWSDYKIFEILYTCYNKIWSNLPELNFNQGNLILKCDKIIDEYLHNKKKQDFFLNDLKILTFYFHSDFSNTFNSYDIPLVKVISNLMTITISIIQDENEIKFWLDEYEKFLVFLIISSVNMTNQSQEYYNLVQDLTIDTVIFGLCFLIDELFNTRKNCAMTVYYERCIKNIFVLCAMILEYFYKQSEKKKKSVNINIFSSLIKKTKKIDYSKTSVFRIFNEYILDRQLNPILSLKMIIELKLSQFIDVPQIFKKEVWRQGLTENPILKEKLRKVFDFSVYETIMRERNEVMKNYSPIYEQKLTIKNLSNKMIIPQNSSTNLTAINSFSKASLMKTAENLITQFDMDLKVYFNNTFISIKNRKGIYRMLKKKLFSWRGMWADRYSFFFNNQKVKMKIFNHYTSAYVKPFLVPILDLNYYLPEFSRFEVENLFIDEESSKEKHTSNIDKSSILAKYSLVNLQITKILDTENLDLGSYSQTTQNETKVTSQQQTYISEIYKINNPDLFSLYQNVENSLENFTKKETNYTELYLNRFKIKSNDPNIRKLEKSYECCLVKASHHIKGILNLNKDGISFYIQSSTTPIIVDKEKDVSNFNSNLDTSQSNYSSSFVQKGSFMIIDNEEDFNQEKNTCWGSFFHSHHKDQEALTYNLPYSEFKYLFRRRYYYKKSAIELFMNFNKSYYFNFKNFSDREMLIKNILSYFESRKEIKIDTKDSRSDEVIAYEFNSPTYIKKGVKYDYFSNKIDSWTNWKISNFEFLMWLNLLGNRSYSDLTQYPVFPWCVKNFAENRIVLPDDMRDFELPMGMMALDEKGISRKRLYMEDYRTMKVEREMSDPPRVYGSHYSNPMYVAHYLTRVFPFSHIMIELQGDRFDDPNRLFLSMKNSFACASSLKGDVRELIPEFYILPEMFCNMNGLNLGYRVDALGQKHIVDNVELPEWCDNNPYEFISKMRTILESEEISKFINGWLDLIFGYKQKGNQAELAYNLFPHWSYEDFNIDFVNQGEKCSYLAQIEFGLTPSQLVSSKPFNEKFAKDYIRRGKQLTESKELTPYINNSHRRTKSIIDQSSSNLKNTPPLMLKIKVIDTDKVLCVFNNNTFNICKFTPNDYKYNMDISSKSLGEVYLQNRVPFFYSECLVNTPMLIYAGGKVIAQGGYFDGKIAVFYQEGNAMKVYYYCTDDGSPIVTLAIDKDDSFIYAGSQNGVLYIFKISEYIWKLESTIYDHYNEICSIAVSNSLNIYATSSLDGYVNLYTYPSNKLFRSIYIGFEANYVFLSSSPLPAVVVYSKISKTFLCYSINGHFLNEEFDECKYIMSPVVFSDISFTDYLVYGTNTGEFKIRKFPNMNLHHKLTLSEKGKEVSPIKCIDITEDKKFAYIWRLDEADLTLIKDPSVTSEAATVNLINMGFGY